MTNFHRSHSQRVFGAVLAAAVVATMPAPSFAQDTSSEARLRKIEAEIRALQRNVFPGGDGRFFEPQITPGNEAANRATTATPNTGAPSTSAVTDILARLDALEAQLQQLTARTEEGTFALGQIEDRLAVLEASRPSANAPDERLDADRGATETNLAAMTGNPAPGSAVSSAQLATGPSPERLAAVQQIAKPQTDDAGDDEYSYGFRLWNAGFYPEARQQLTRFVEEYPSHWRLTYGRNLLGRAFLADGMAEEAARWFLRNYQTDRTGERAPDSLLYLAEAMIAMNDTRRACIALAEFGETYTAAATGRLAAEYEANRRKVTCG